MVSSGMLHRVPLVRTDVYKIVRFEVFEAVTTKTAVF
jgi:hypothetical protein